MNARHVKWLEHLQSFNLSFKYKADKVNVVLNALGRKYNMLAMLEAKILGFEVLRVPMKRMKISKSCVSCARRGPKGCSWLMIDFISNATSYVF